jgi:hypothetical protein
MRTVIGLILFSILTAIISALPTARPNISLCNPAKGKLLLPRGQYELRHYYFEKPVLIAVGVGIQNYTCSDKGKYVSTGAVAELWDISCIAQSDFFYQIEEFAIKHYDPHHGKPLSIEEIPFMFPSLGDHFFIPTPEGHTALSPKFDFTSSHGGESATFIVGSKVGEVRSPRSRQHINWVEYSLTEGNLAKHVFLTDTYGGQPPESCHPGSGPVSVTYAAKYWFFD